MAPEVDVANFYRQASATLRTAGYEHYELSSYALLSSAHAVVPATTRTIDTAKAAAAAATDSAVESGTFKRPEERSKNTRLPRSPHRSKHNACYWAMRPFLGFGLGASSMVANGARVARPRDAEGFADFVATLEQGSGGKGGGGELPGSTAVTGEILANDRKPRENSDGNNKRGDNRDSSSSCEQRSAARALLLGDAYSSLNSDIVSDDDSSSGSDENAAQYEALLEGLMVALRTSDGFDLDQCAANYGDVVTGAIVTAAQDAKSYGLAVIVSDDSRSIAAAKAVPETSREMASFQSSSEIADAGDGSRGIMRLTDPEGFLFSNQVISTLFAALEPEMLQPSPNKKK